jgi:hypothetical protein
MQNQYSFIDRSVVMTEVILLTMIIVFSGFWCIAVEIFVLAGYCCNWVLDTHSFDAAYWLHLQGSVVQFFIGYLTLEDEATVWSPTGTKQTPSFRGHYPRRISISVVVVVMWSEKWAIKEGNVEITDCKPSLFSYAVCYKFCLEEPGLTHLHNTPTNECN